MKRFLKPLLISSMLMPTTIRPKFDITSLLAGIAGTLGVGGVYSWWSSNSEQQEIVAHCEDMCNKLSSALVKASLYTNECRAVDEGKLDESIRKIAVLLGNETQIPGNCIEQVGRELTNLNHLIIEAEKDYHTSAIEEPLRQSLVHAIKEAKEVKNQLQKLYSFVKAERPFIELTHALAHQHATLESYDTMMHTGTKFPTLDTVDRINKDATAVHYWQAQANDLCNQQPCTVFQRHLVAAAQQHVTSLNQKQKNIANSSKFLEERYRHQALETERQLSAERTKKAELVLAQELVKKNEQEIKQEQLRQNDKQLRQNEEQQKQNRKQQELDAEILRQGRWFEPTKQKLEREIAQLQQKMDDLRYENKRCNTRLENAQSELKRLKEEKNLLEVNLKKSEEQAQTASNILTSAITHTQQLENHLQKPLPLNPESEEGAALAAYLNQAKEYLKKLKAQLNGSGSAKTETQKRLQDIAHEAQKIEQLVQNPPVSPQSEDYQTWAGFLQKVKEHAQGIRNRSQA